MSSFYGGGRIANATVRVTPDTRTFEAQLQAAINKAFANLKVPEVDPTGRASKGAKEATKSANALRGALIGLSRVTPVTVFGLGIYGTAGIAAGLAIQSAIKATAEFEKQLNTLQAVTGVTDEQLEQIRQTAISLGGDTSLAAISAGDAAVALNELAKAGLSVEDSLSAVRGVLELAGASGLSAGVAAKFVATELNAFKLAGDQAQRVVDLLASASIAAQGEIEDFGNAFQQVSAVAAQAGLSVEQTTAALTQLARAGITSSDAGTSLRTFLLRLIPTTKQAGAFVQALGVTLDESKTEGEQLTSVIAQYRSALLALGPVQRTAVLNQIFGQDAVRAASILLTQNSGALKRQIDDLDDAGVAAQLNAAKAKGLSGAIAALSSNMETTGIKIGRVVDGPLEGLVRSLSDGVTQSDRLAGRIGELVTAFSKLKPVEVTVDVVVTATDAIPGPIKSFLKTVGISALLPGVGAQASLLQALGLADDLTGGAPNTNKAVPTLGKKAAKIQAQFSVNSLFAGFNTDIELDKAFGKAADDAAKKNKALRAKVAKVQAEQNGLGPDGKPLDLDLVAPQRLQVGLLNAQISGSLKAELEADKRILDFFQKRLDNTRENTPRYLKLLKSVQAADAAVDSVQKQINDEAKARQKEQEDLLKQRREDAAKLAKARIDLQNEVLNTRLGKAQLTETIADDLKVYRSQIKLAEDDIARQKKLAAKAKEGTQARVDALLAIQADLQRINGIKAAIKSLKEQDQGKSGFSLNDLFQEAVGQLRDFGSNVSANPMTPGQAGRTVFAGYAASFAGLSKADRAKLEKQAETNVLLQKIIDAITVPSRPTGSGLKGVKGFLGNPKDPYYLSPGYQAHEKAKRISTKIGQG